ncbi:MAG: hypothetical protein AMXMBFR23_24170 [Chloroflexota bacterium]
MPDTFRVAILQLAASPLAAYEAAFDEALRRVDDAARDEPDLIVLPEATVTGHYLGDRDAVARTAWYTDADVLRALGERAKRHRCYIAAGLVLRTGGGLQNAAVLIAPDGVEVARATEAHPAPWFLPGGGPVAANPRAVPAMLVAGTDLLVAQYAAALGTNGTRLIISTGAPRGWVRGGRSGSAADIVLPARAAEAGAWIVSAGRTGHEAGLESYAGGAGVLAPDGTWAVRAPADRAGLVVHAIDLDAAAPRSVTTPSAPGGTPTGATTAGTTTVAAIALDPVPSTVDLMESVRALVRAAAAQGAEVVVLPDLAGADPRAVSKGETLPLIEALAAQVRVAVVVALTERAEGATYKTAFAVEGGRTVAAHRAGVLSDAERAAGFTPGDTLPPVIELRGRGIGLLAGEEGLVASVAASLRERGAGILAWCAGGREVAVEVSARARAWEQRVPVAVASGAGILGGGFVIESGGTLIAATPEGTAGVAVGAVEARA